MEIGVISDTHDNLDNLEEALAILRGEDITTLVHCGDVCGAGVIEALADFDVWIARGNMDRDPELSRAVEKILGDGRLAHTHTLTLGGYSAAVSHGADGGRLRGLIASGEYLYVFHGHTHRRRDQWVGSTRVINPGALGGIRWQQRSFCILDLETDEIQFIEL